MNSISQVSRVRAHLEAGKSITPGHALLVYGISRLAVAIQRLRDSGMDIDMILREDEAGKKYGEYRTARPVAIGSRVQVQRGHGIGLPRWVLMSAASKVVGLVKDVAYVAFEHRNGNTEILPLNLKELVRVG